MLVDTGRTQGSTLEADQGQKGTVNATDVATKHVDAATLQKFMNNIGFINRTRFLAMMRMA